MIVQGISIVFWPLTIFHQKNKIMSMAIDTYTQLSVKDSPESDHLGTIIWKISRMYVIRAKGGGLRILRTLFATVPSGGWL